MNTRKLMLRWLCVAVWILVIMAAIALFAKFTGAHDVLKWQICDSLNITGGDCDDLWNSLNGELDDNISLDDYFDKDEIEEKFTVTNDSVITLSLRISNLSDRIDNINLTPQVSEINWEEKMEELEILSEDEIKTMIEGQAWKSQSNSGSSGGTNNTIIFGGIILALVLGGGLIYMYTQNKNQRPQAQQTNIPRGHNLSSQVLENFDEVQLPPNKDPQTETRKSTQDPPDLLPE